MLDKLFVAFLRRADEGTFSRLLVEISVVLASWRSNGANALREAAAAYKVDMVGTVVWPANHMFLLVDSVTRTKGKLPTTPVVCRVRWLRPANRAAQWVSPVFHAALVQTGDVGDQALQGTCNLFGPLTVATITRSRKPTSLRMRPVTAPNNWKAARLATGLQEGIGLAINHTFTTELGGNVRVASTRSQAPEESAMNIPTQTNDAEVRYFPSLR
jgi:hypothetical protein